jgi:hypothetical protein
MSVQRIQLGSRFREIKVSYPNMLRRVSLLKEQNDRSNFATSKEGHRYLGMNAHSWRWMACV